MNTVQFSTAASDRPFQVVIVGGGIAGLSSGWYLQQEAKKHHLELNYTLLEHSNRWGGKIQTESVTSVDDTPFILESGPDAFLTRKAGVVNLAQELGLNARILGVNTSKSRTYVVNGGHLTPLPDGMQLLVPTRLIPFLRSPLFSIWGKLRVGLDWFIPARKNQSDESLASFVRRRLGAEVLDKLAEPLLSGVYNAEPESQSMVATFPQFPALERDFGSLLRGARESARKRPANDLPAFISFQTGAHELVDALVSQLSGDLRLNMPVYSVEQAGEQYRVVASNGEEFLADAVILATPAKVSASMMKHSVPKAAVELETIRYSSIGAVYLAFTKLDVEHELDGFGVVVPRSEQRQIDGITWVSSKWSERAPSDSVLLRVFFGGPNTRTMMQLSDEALVKVVRGEVQSLLGIDAEPLFSRIIRWPEGYPQYELGHLERVRAIEAALPQGLYVTGSSYRGIGVPDCIKQGQNTAQQIIQYVVKQFTESDLSPAEGAY